MKKYLKYVTLALSAAVIVGCSQEASAPESVPTEETTVISTPVEQPSEAELIEQLLNDENTADDDFLRMVKAAGGFDAYEQKLQDSDVQSLTDMHSLFGLSFTSSENDLSAQNISSCVRYFPSSDRNRVFRLGSHITFIDSSGRPAYGNLGFGPRTVLIKGARQRCQTTVGQWGNSGDVGGHLIASVLGGYGGRANVVPQNGTMNNSTWKSIENKVRKCATSSYSGRYRAIAIYQNNTTLRPSVLRSTLNLYRWGWWPVVAGGISMPNRVPTYQDRLQNQAYLANYTPYCG